MRKLILFAVLLAEVLILDGCTSEYRSADADNLAGNFANPPDDCRPWVYWFWLNSNITREGITADLEAMKRVGIGGVLIMEVDQGAPVGPVDFMGVQWRELFSFMVSEAARLGIEVNMNNDAGWNGSGGPWVPLEKSMQVVVTSEVSVPAGKPFSGILPRPEANRDFYRDIAVLAFPTPADAGNPAYRIKGLAGKSYSTVDLGSGNLDVSKGESVSPENLVKSERVIDISAYMDTAGNLSWDAPGIPGGKGAAWTVIRFGHTFTGAVNGPSPLSGQGPECDKLSPEGIEANYEGMMGKLVKDVGPLAGKTLAATHVDSWEVGPQNWTPKMREEFKRYRGYEMTRWMPVLTGRVVDSPELSERFLRDFRQTISDLVAVNYIGRLRELARRDGMRLTMEAYTTPANDLDVGNHIDEPISEFWTTDGGGLWWSQKSMSSLAHVNGLPITGAESFTSGGDERWLAHPATIKALGDRAFCDGVNRFIFHRYALQPWVPERKPGMTMGPWGLHYERTQTWWEDSYAWHMYLSRCQYMLRQGQFVADVLCLNSEEPLERFRMLKLDGYDYDGISPQKFLRDVSFTDGMLTLPSGMKYRLLVLPDNPEMSVGMLEKIDSLVDAGATVTGKAPVRAPGLAGYPESDARIRTLAAKLWGTDPSADRIVGRGRVVSGKSPSEVLATLGVRPDFVSSGAMTYIHRTVGETEVYFISSQELKDADFTCRFRVTGLKPEVWDPETGRIGPVTAFAQEDGITTIPLHLEQAGSRFIVFRKGALSDSDRIVSVKSDDQELAPMAIEPQRAVAPPEVIETKDNFTIAAWVNPEMRISLPEEADMGTNALSVDRNDVVYAVPGHEVWTGKDAGAGFGVGTNGVVVTEHTANYFPAILSWKGPVAGWNHVAVVYRDGRPGLWINGKLVRTGLKSKHTVHGGYGVVHTRKLKDFTGRAAGIVQIPKALKENEILDLMKVVPDTAALIRPLQRVDLLKREILVNGNYELRNAKGAIRSVIVADIPEKQVITGPWSVSFTPGWGAPDKIDMERLVDWSQHPDEGVKFYSGSAVYTATFRYVNEPSEANGLKALTYLDLGRVAVMARVRLNGRDLGMLWKPPYRIEVTRDLIDGDNKLEIKVLNLWINRMIGDEQLPEDSDRNPNGTLKSWPQWLMEGRPSPTGRFTFTSWRLWSGDSDLQPSGLLGPVSLHKVMKF